MNSCKDLVNSLKKFSDKREKFTITANLEGVAGEGEGFFGQEFGRWSVITDIFRKELFLEIDFTV